LNVQVETVWLVQTGASLAHFVPAGQGGAAASEQAVSVWAWQTMPAPQSLSAVHGPGWQVEIVVPVEPGWVVPGLGVPVPPSTAVGSPPLVPGSAGGVATVPPFGTAEPPVPPTPAPCAAAPPVPLVGQPTSAGQPGSVVPTTADT